MTRTQHRRVILDVDSSEGPEYGGQEGAACSGHFASVGYDPLFMFNPFGDCEGAELRPGNVLSAHDWMEVLERVATQWAGRAHQDGRAADAPRSAAGVPVG